MTDGARDPSGSDRDDAGGLDRPQLLARNSLLNLAGLGLPLVLAVFAVPVILDGLGAGGFGILSLVWVVLGYIALLDLGLGRATTKFAAEALAVGDHRRVGASAKIAAASQVALGLLAGLGLALATPFVVEEVLDVEPGLVEATRRSFYLLAAIAPVVMVTNTFRGLLEAAQRFGTINAIRVPVSAANYVLPLVGVLLGWSVPLIVGSLLGMRVLMLAAYAVAALRAFPGTLREARVHRADVRELVTFGGWVTVSSLISPILVYLDRFVVGAVRDLSAVGYYSAPHELVMRLTILPSAVAATLFPAMSAAASGPETDRLGHLAGRALRLLLLAAGPLIVLLGVLAGDVLEVWLGPAVAAEATAALRLFALGMAANVAAYVPAVLLPAAGRPDVLAKIHLLELPIHLLLLYVLVTRWGITGAAAAWCIRMWLDAVLLFTASGRLGLLRPGVLARQLGGVLVWVAVVLAGVSAAGLAIDARVPRVAAGAAFVLLMAPVAWAVVLSGAERRGLVAAIGVRR